MLATGMVLLLALGVGRQLVCWYRVESPPIQAAAASRPPLAGLAGGEPIELDFGDAPHQIQRREIAGDLAAARAALVAACRDMPARLPLTAPSPAENSLLELCRRELPAITTSDGRLIFAPQTALPLVVVLRPIAQPSTSPELAASENRVVTWGLAAPAGPDGWHLYVAHADRDPQAAPGANSAASAASDFGAAAASDLPLPAGAHRMLKLSDRRGGSLLSFAGQGHAAEWIAFFATWFGGGHWTRPEDWRFAEGFWRARYERENEAERTTVDLEIGRNGAKGLVGFATIDRQAHERPASPDLADQHGRQ